METNFTRDTIYVDGQWVPAQGTGKIEVISAYSEQVIATVPQCSRDDIDLAVKAARSAFDKGPWPRMSAKERVAVIARLRDIIEQRQEEIAQAISAEMGSPITQARSIQASLPVKMLDEQMQIAANEYPWSEIRESVTGKALVRRLPKGVAVLITPWNAPLMTTIQKLGPALLAGCSVVLKPASLAPLSAYLLAEMAHEAGIPAGVLNVVTCDRAEAEYLVLHSGVDKVTFTGSTGAGSHLAAACGKILRPITLELGGKSAAIITEDADIPAAVEALKMLSFRNSGQICTLKTRVLVAESRATEFTQAFKAMVESLPVGDPSDPSTIIGPMVSEKQRDNVVRYIEIGIKEGLSLVTGGLGRPEGLNHGWFVKPTVFADVDQNASLAQEEIFGPVVTITSFETEDEAVAIANNSIFGLSGTVFSKDVDRAVSIADCIKTGVVEINGNPFGFHAPFGGVKQSGMGRENGWEGFESYVELKSIGLPRDYSPNAI
ncbi:aldehyde dehydrogenase [Donghicola mangrovi]|uniref:Aldehyde dehydrogenase n=1 Tax=Donghicola mangrovi TaxID=2729614 RepID=A0A850QHA1_9RHOB|nr:aldehyde dehydrogenase [Donghicola mangrovi]NVO25429.1 aldehyde dehydrogenase [Donghicola mangrovi]